MTIQSSRLPKHIQVLDYLLKAIKQGEYRAGDRLPIDTELARMFGASRPTVAKALGELQARGLVDRRVGSGTYVAQSGPHGSQGELIGLLVPDTRSTEIFDSIVRHISREAQRLGNAILLGDLGDVRNAQVTADQKALVTEAACRRLIAQGVSGVLFAPVEFTSNEGLANRRVLSQLEQAAIPVVLIDRDVGEFEHRSRHDLVSVNHIRAGFLLAKHLITAGRTRIAFLAREKSAQTSMLRRAGVREAICQAGERFSENAARYGRPEEIEFVRNFIGEVQPDAVVCSNDETAAQLMLTLEDLGMNVPEEIAVVGIDNVHYGELLRTPLTTISQPCEEISQIAVQTLLSRIAEPNMPILTISLEPKLVVRKSCGAHLNRGGGPTEETRLPPQQTIVNDEPSTGFKTPVAGTAIETSR